MRKILFPFELNNPNYRDAYIYGIKYARKINAELIMLNVFKVEVGDDITEEKYSRLKRDNWFKAYNEISKFNKYYLEDFADVETDLHIRFDYRFINGILLDEINKVAMEEEVDLIVLPMSELREFNNRQLKIIRDNVLEKNRTSLLMIPYSCEFKPVRNIVFATDLKKLLNYQLYLNDVVRYARMFDANIHFIHVSTKDKEEEWDHSKPYGFVMEAIVKNERHTFKSLHGKKVVESINQYAENCQADLVVVVKHQYHFLESILHESVSKEISMNSKVPVLVMREKSN